MNKKGFTLIELLVVIAVIGILASILLVGYAGVRDRAKETRVIAEMSQLRIVAEDFYSKNDKYTGFENDANATSIIADIKTQTGGTNVTVHATTNTYCAEIKLGEDNYFCIDSQARAVRLPLSVCKEENIQCYILTID